LTPDIDEEDLKKAYSPYGEIHSTFIKREKSGKSKGFGFVNFLQDESRDKALSDSMNIIIRGVRVTTHMSYNKSSLYVGGFPRNMGKDELRIELESITGMKISSVKMKDGEVLFLVFVLTRLSGFCYVSFARREDAEMARGILSQSRIRGHTLTIDSASRKVQFEISLSVG
jgi:polyadenylate-binding protein